MQNLTTTIPAHNLDDPRYEPATNRWKRTGIKAASVATLFAIAAYTTTGIGISALTALTLLSPPVIITAAVAALAYRKMRETVTEVDTAIKELGDSIKREEVLDKRLGLKDGHAVALEKEMARLSRMLKLPKPILHPTSGQGPAILENEKAAIMLFDSNLLDVLDRHEVEKILIHELAHHRGDHVMGGAFFRSMNSGAISATGIDYLAGWAGGLGLKASWLEGMNIGLPGTALLGYLGVNHLLAQYHSRTNEYVCDALGPRITGSGIGIATGLSKIILVSMVDAYNQNPKSIEGFVMADSVSDYVGSHPSLGKRVAQAISLTDPKILADNPETAAMVSKINARWLVDFVKAQGAKHPGSALDHMEVVQAFQAAIKGDQFQAYMNKREGRVLESDLVMAAHTSRLMNTASPAAVGAVTGIPTRPEQAIGTGVSVSTDTPAWQRLAGDGRGSFPRPS